MVSVIIPVYNVEAYIRECVDSVLNQTYTRLQVILVDDGSPDNCGAICDEYARMDSRVLSLHKDNGGVSSARNFGLEYAVGEYVTFCDSDDMYAPDWIETMVTTLKIQHADVAVGNYIKMHEDLTFGDQSAHEISIDNICQDQARIGYIFNKILTPCHGWEVCFRLFRTEIIQREKIRFCETCGNFAEDLGFTLAYTLFAERVTSVACAGYHYRIRSGSMMNKSAYDPKLESLQEVCSFCRPWIQRVFDPDVADLFYRNLQFNLLGNQVSSYLWASGMKPDEFRNYVVANTSDWEHLEEQIRILLKDKHTLGMYVSRSRRAEILAHLQFLLEMPWIILRIQCKLIRMFRSVLDYKVR